MQEKYDRKKVKISFRKFNDFASDVLNSDDSTFESNFEIFIDHCENDEIMSIICNQLKYNNAIFDKWWSENNIGENDDNIGSKNFKKPLNENERVALYYQLCLKINKAEIQLLGFCQDFINCTPDGAIVYFNKNIVTPMVRSIKYELDEIVSEGTIEQVNKADIPKEALFIYLDYSTTVNGGVNTKGQLAMGGVASVEKKSIL